MSDILTIIIIILVIGWAGGYFAFHVGGSLIHLLLVIAIIILIIKLIRRI